MKDRVVLAYSGGLDTSVAIRWIIEKYDSDVITVTVDVGQGGDLKSICETAEKIGAIKHYTIDARDEFVKGYVYPAVKANALYQGKYPISTALSRPLIASKLVEVARKEGANAVAHGCTGKGNDQVRFDVTIASLAPDLKIIAPIREWGPSREEEIEYARDHDIPVLVKPGSAYSIDRNLYGRSIECGVLEDPMAEPPEEVFELTVSPEESPNRPQYLTLEFEKGIPKSLDGSEEAPVDMLNRLSEIAGRNGVGRIDHIEDRLIGIKSREVYECPAATVLVESHKDLEKCVLTRHELDFKQLVDMEWTLAAYTGLWTDPLLEDLGAFIDKTQEKVSGTVKVKLFKGNCRVVGRSSPMSLYNRELATYEVGTAFDQKIAGGFIELWGLQTKIANIVKRKMESGRDQEPV
ncbi:argininosuccinate synthase [Candidatus Bathyarchaeota archaeon]|nr:argininosuccinate synthase [Candidatus Bathyarchaeota archaeon]